MDDPPAGGGVDSPASIGVDLPAVDAIGSPADVDVDLYAALAPRLTDDEQRRLLRALLDRLAKGGGPAVKEEVRLRLRAILAERP